jgi:putative inorganic carbon (HCO3(-)) transporter
VGQVNAKREGHLVLALLGLGLAALLVAGAVAAWGWSRSPEPGVTYGVPSWVPLAADKTLGVNADLSRSDAEGQEKALAAMEAAGFRWLRQRFPWDAIEPEQGVFDWAVWDEIVESAARHHLSLIAVLDGSPAWARAGEDAGNPLAPPVETRDYGAFVAAFAGRYGAWIDHYQLWDEPNIAPHWGTREIDVAAYARLLREGAIQVRAADPGAVVLAAALAPNVEPGGANMSDVRFLDLLYQQGAAEWFDVVAAQPYGFDEPATAPPDLDRLNWRRPALLREVMAAHGDEATAVWAVSFGWRDVVPEMVKGVVEQSWQDWPWLGPMLWAAFSPGDVHGEYALTGAGAILWNRDSPAYEALRESAAALAAPTVAWPGAYPADHLSGRYEGDWRVTPSGADIGGSGDRLTIAFWGTRLDLTVRRGDYRAFLFVKVDGQPANALPRDGQGQAYVVLYDPLQATDSVTLARNLPEGDHVAEIVAERGWGQWAVVGWTAARELPSRLPWLPIALGLAALVVLAVTVVKVWPNRAVLAGSLQLFPDRYFAFDRLDDRLMLGITAGAAILLYITVGTIPVLTALGLVAVLLFLRPKMGLPLIALALPFYQLGRPLLGKVFSMVEILALLTAVGGIGRWILGLGRSKPGKTRHAPGFTSYVSRFTALDWGVIALIAVGALSLLWAEYGRVAAREYRTVVLESAIFYGLLRAMVRERRDAWRVADAWVLGGAAIAVVGLSQWAQGQNLITAEGVWRARGFYGSPNNLALYLGRVLPLGVAIVLWARRGWRRWTYGLAALLMAAALFLTYSRGAWLLGVPISLLFLAAMRGRRALAVAVGLLLVVAVILVLVVGAGRLTSLLDTTEGTTFFRLQLWQSSWAMIRDHPLLGVGLDNFLYHYRTYYVLPDAWEEFDLSHPHNLVFDFWLRLGLPGLIVLVWLLAAFFRRSWRAYRALPEGSERLLVLGLMGGMVDFLAHGLVDNAYFLVDLAFVFMLMLALVQVTSDQHRIS